METHVIVEVAKAGNRKTANLMPPHHGGMSKSLRQNPSTEKNEKTLGGDANSAR